MKLTLGPVSCRARHGPRHAGRLKRSFPGSEPWGLRSDPHPEMATVCPGRTPTVMGDTQDPPNSYDGVRQVAGPAARAPEARHEGTPPREQHRPGPGRFSVRALTTAVETSRSRLRRELLGLQ